jgi:hypothetical protein
MLLYNMQIGMRAALRLLIRRHQADADSVPHETCNVMDIKPGHQLHAVGLDRFHTEVQDRRDLLGRVSFGDEL